MTGGCHVDLIIATKPDLARPPGSYPRTIVSASRDGGSQFSIGEQTRPIGTSPRRRPSETEKVWFSLKQRRTRMKSAPMANPDGQHQISKTTHASTPVAAEPAPR